MEVEVEVQFQVQVVVIVYYVRLTLGLLVRELTELKAISDA